MVKLMLKLCKAASVSGLFVMPNFKLAAQKINIILTKAGKLLNINLTRAGSCLIKN